jgi:hypothetical protein
MTLLLNWRIWLYGILSWLIPFGASFLFFDPSGGVAIPQPLFKSSMVVIGGATGAGLLVLVFRKAPPSVASGLVIGLLWLVINLGLDLAVLVPMSKMAVTDYLYDIGLRYILLPIVAIAMGAVGGRGE